MFKLPVKTYKHKSSKDLALSTEGSLLSRWKEVQDIRFEETEKFLLKKLKNGRRDSHDKKKIIEQIDHNRQPFGQNRKRYYENQNRASIEEDKRVSPKRTRKREGSWPRKMMSHFGPLDSCKEMSRLHSKSIQNYLSTRKVVSCSTIYCAPSLWEYHPIEEGSSEYQFKGKCAYHINQRSHTIDECIALKTKICKMINTGKIRHMWGLYTMLACDQVNPQTPITKDVPIYRLDLPAQGMLHYHLLDPNDRVSGDGREIDATDTIHESRIATQPRIWTNQHTERIPLTQGGHTPLSISKLTYSEHFPSFPTRVPTTSAIKTTTIDQPH
ncbi:hypothetical protein HAX54_032461 [Datura stramonium]|uniref:Uncharacterized protein n=1 Tax=Datura stramonium TaxID=4076 RepID=A0ABS8VEA9_DATST|nr:hypothetical protein [Datura stramonium]